MKVLKEISVIELGMYLPLPYAGAFLSQIGATVTKVELPGKGDPMKELDDGIYTTLNKNKKIIYQNLKDEKDIKQIKEILNKADIVLNGFRRGFLDKLGLGYKEISKKNKGVIYINLYGYPKELSFKDKAGHDLNFLSLSGIFDWLSGYNRPLPIQIADMSGALWAIIGSLLMLNKRRETNKGGELDLSLFSSLLSFMPFFYFSEKGGKIEKGFFHGTNPFYNIYECKDGKLIAVGSVEEKFARKLLEILKIKYDDNIFLDIKEEYLSEKIKEAFKKKNQKFFLSLFEKEDICVSPVLSREEFYELLSKNGIKGENLSDFVIFPIK